MTQTRPGIFPLIVIVGNIISVRTFLVSDGLQLVHTNLGDIVGHVKNVQFDGKTSQVATFLGIPYAEPPVGVLRFRKPVPRKPFTSPFAAHSFGPQCLQQSYATAKRSEDCLFLNVYVPANLGQSGILPKPVMVWIHGGGFVFGNADAYRGDVLSAYTDVIVVTINYRLGPMGFFSTHDEHARGNYGVWDQHVAIRWVYDNIEAFGGDRHNITIFGESAGSSSVIYQLMYPGNDGIFKRAIAESGSINGWGVTKKEVNYNSSLIFASTLGCDMEDHESLLKCIRSKNQAEVESAVAKIANFTNSLIHQKWAPVYDGEFVIADPMQMLKEASDPLHISMYSSFRNKDLIIGANNFDGDVVVEILSDNFNRVSTISDTELTSVFIPSLIEYVTQMGASTAVVDAVKNEYKDYTGAIDNLGSFIQMSTDSVLNAPTITTANAHELNKQANTYLYQFSTSPPKRESFLPAYWNSSPNAANHFDEVPYVFGFISVFQQTPRPSDLEVSKLMMTAWSNFARSGDPNVPRSLQSMFNVHWPSYTVEGGAYLEITPNISQRSIHNRLAARGVAFWNDLIPSLMALSKQN